MTRSERLLYLLTVLKKRNVVHIKEIARECDISPRTVYRDINALLDLGYNVYYDQGYHLAPESAFPVDYFEPGDLGIILHAVQCSPLKPNSFFEKRISVIEQKLSQLRAGDTKRLGGEYLIFDSLEEDIHPDSHSDALASFLRAIQIRRKIRVRLSKGYTGWQNCVPIAVRISHKEPGLLMQDENGDLLEEPVGNIEDIYIASAHFNRRPIELVPELYYMEDK